MRTKLNLRLLSSLAIAGMLLTGCASYNARSLDLLPVAQTTSSQDNVIVCAKAWNQAECKKYLDRDVIRKGYRPVQLCIQNNSDEPYLFALERLDMCCAPPEEVAPKVHTSTVGRAVGYGAAAWFTFGLLAIPAVVDGVKSANANEALDLDFSSKCARNQFICPHSHMNALLFVPTASFRNAFKLTLVNEQNGEPREFTVTVS